MKMLGAKVLRNLLKISKPTVISHYASSAFAVTYKEFGDPNKVLEGTELPVKEPGEHEIRIRMMASPINPGDCNTIQGIYPIKPNLPAVAGNEGVGVILEVGPDVPHLQPGNHVLTAVSGTGSWCSEKVTDARSVIPIATDIPVVEAASLAVNPCTAYRMLKDFVKLERGDVVIQNGANSHVGQAVIQIAKDMKLRTINVVRDRPNIKELTDTLKEMGATEVVTDDFLWTSDMRRLVESMPARPKLALNCAGGRVAAGIMKFLARGGTMVTYGGMSRQHLQAPAGPLIFDNIQLQGFWMTQWTADNRTSRERINMLKALCDMVKRGKLRTTNYRLVPIENFKDAVAKSMEPFHTEKQILTMD